MAKILDITTQDFLGALSLQTDFGIGGQFKTLKNFDPFDDVGSFTPTAAPIERTGAASTIRWMTSVDVANNSYGYGLADSSKLYQLTLLTGGIQDVSSEVSSFGNARGAIVWRDKYIYAGDTVVYGNTIPVASGSDVTLLSGLDDEQHPMAIGADLNLYIANGNKVARLTNEAGTSSNSTNVFALDTGMKIRDLKNDGRYLVILADDNETRNDGTFRCVLAFWNMVDGTLAQRFDFSETTTYAMEIVHNTIYVFGRDNLYVANVSSRPQAIVPFRNSTVTGKPFSPSMVSTYRNGIIWAGEGTQDGNKGQIFAYGSLVAGQDKQLYHPYTNGNINGESTALLWNGARLWTATDSSASNNCYQFNSQSTKATATMEPVVINFSQPYQLDFVRITTQRQLASGETITCKINSLNGNGLVMDSSTFSFANDGAKSEKVFYPKNANVPHFDGFDPLTITTNGCPIRRVQVFGQPIEIQSQGV